MGSEVEREDRVHFEKACLSRSFPATMAKLFVSCDQLSRTGRNLGQAVRGAAAGRFVQPAEFFSSAAGADVEAIVSSHVPEHVDDDKALLSRLNRCPRSGGVLQGMVARTRQAEHGESHQPLESQGKDFSE